jgi:hypothetical protein
MNINFLYRLVEQELVYPSGAPEFTSDFLVGLVLIDLKVLCVVICKLWWGIGRGLTSGIAKRLSLSKSGTV